MRGLAITALLACACSDRIEPAACSFDGNCADGFVCAASGFCAVAPACPPPFQRSGTSCTVGHPTGVTAVGGQHQVQVRWTAQPGATSYIVGRASLSGGPYQDVGRPNDTSFLDTSPEPATSYWYVVRAIGPGGEGSASAEASALTVPDAPATLTATGGQGAISLSWSAVAGATGYTITRATAGGAFTVLAGSTTATYVDGGLSSSATFSYQVLALNSSGPSAPSPTATAAAN